MGFTPVSIHTQFRSSFFLTMVTSRHLSTSPSKLHRRQKCLFSFGCKLAQTPCQYQRHRQQRALRGGLQINMFHPLPSQRLQFLSTARLRSLGYHIARPPFLLQARRNLITQKNENLKSADSISAHVMGRATRSFR